MLAFVRVLCLQLPQQNMQKTKRNARLFRTEKVAFHLFVCTVSLVFFANMLKKTRRNARSYYLKNVSF